MSGSTTGSNASASTVVSRDVVVRNRQGIHARPSAAFVKLASQFRCEVTLEKDGESINGKSIMGLLMLAAGPGSRIRIVCDGCTDDTARLARAAIADHPWTGVDIVVEEHPVNRGKVAVLNEAIAEETAELVLLTDASAALPPDALVRLAAHFVDPSVGVAGGRYVLDRPGSPGEAVYWAYQTEIKRTEACLGSPMGFHGAGYMVRRDRWSPMEPDTINDDFVMPMRIVADGSRGVYDSGLQTLELERSQPGQEFRRRVRIGAGNLQQAIRLMALADPRRPGLAFVFLSSKFLRAFMPLLLVATLLSSLVLAADGVPFFQFVAALQVAGYGFCAALLATRELPWPKLLRLPAYLVEGYAAGLVGTLRYMAGRERGRWGRAGAEVVPDFVPPSIRWAKRGVDIVVASLVFVVFALTFPFVALAIRLDSKGPIFYRQLRVGEATPRFTRLFYMIKYRSMRIDAESTGAMWATSNDPRVTRVGRFMRKTRIDELPQCLNVLEEKLPYYAERHMVKPGITGWAQINYPYGASIEDSRHKLEYDLYYAKNYTPFLDLLILLQTLRVVLWHEGAR